MTPSNPVADLVVAYGIDLDATTGSFVGFGTLTSRELVLIHARAAKRLLAHSPKSQLRLRIQIRDDVGNLEVMDGTVYVSVPGGGVELPPAVQLDRSVKTYPAELYWEMPLPQLAQTLTELEQRDPAESPLPPPDVPDPHDQPSFRGPWCIPFPNCPGCKP